MKAIKTIAIFTLIISSFLLLKISDANATACTAGFNINPSCPDNPGLKKVPDGANVTKCPTDHPEFSGCVSEGGTNYLCCTDPNYKEPTVSICGPDAAIETGYTYQCVQDEKACTKLGGSLYTGLGKEKCPLAIITPGVLPCCQIAKPANAKANTSAPTGKTYVLTNPLGSETSIEAILGRIIGAFLGIIGAFALMAFVYAGVIWMLAQGDKNDVKKAQDIMKSAAIGLFIIGFAYTLTSSFMSLFKTIPPSAGTTGPAGTENVTQAEGEQAQLESNLEQQANQNQQTTVPDGKVIATVCGKQGTIPADKVTEYSKYECLNKADYPIAPCIALQSGSDPCSDQGLKCCLKITGCEKVYGSDGYKCQSSSNPTCKQINNLCPSGQYCCK